MDAKKVLAEELKKAGLDIAEDAAIDVVKAVFDALPKFFAATENKYDDMAIPMLPLISVQLIKLIDKIDGEEG